jgi:hypothetical protein
MTALRRTWIAAGVCVACVVALALMPSGVQTVELIVGGWILGATIGDWRVERRRRHVRALARTAR